ncbi:hypothetical protein imdm_1746 [gamma proteobacterium IMCC2047]|nr:hypothetical protein imdm_1746 [gamma proteobacterium IMCC2047]
MPLYYPDISIFGLSVISKPFAGKSVMDVIDHKIGRLIMAFKSPSLGFKWPILYLILADYYFSIFPTHEQPNYK